MTRKQLCRRVYRFGAHKEMRAGCNTPQTIINNRHTSEELPRLQGSLAHDSRDQAQSLSGFRPSRRETLE